MNWDDNLSEAQKIAAKHIGSHARLLAGPGTGKTLVIARRILFLIQNEGVSPDDILVLTFTRAAAKELRHRILSGIGDLSSRITISTLHSYALKTILHEGAAMRLPQPIRIADDWEERNIIQEDIKSILGLQKIKDARELLEKLSADWEQLTIDQVPNRFPDPRFLGAWNEHREIFGYTLRAELVYQLRHALEEGHIQIGRSYKYIFVDEYQDLNPCDLSVVKMVIANGGELFVSGDDDQSIYGFRFADPEGIRRFDQDYKNSTSLTLEECKRCGKNILEIATYVAQQDPRRYPKTIFAAPDAPQSEVHILKFRNQFDEARFVAKISKWLNKNSNVRLEDILILLRGDRNNIFSTLIRKELIRLNLEVDTVINAYQCLDEDEGRIFLSLLRLVVNVNDHLAWRTLLQNRDNNIGEVVLKELYEKARIDGRGFSQILFEVANNPTVILRFGNRIANEIISIQESISTLNDMFQNTEELFDNLANAVNHFVQDPDIKTEINSLFEQVFTTTSPTTLDELLRTINVSLGNMEQDQKSDSISIMSMHQAKGLTAEAVIIVGAEDEFIPGRAQGLSIGDEQRLLYVSLSRAKRYLFITHCHERIYQQAHTGRNPGTTTRVLTRFLRGGPIRSEDGNLFADQLH